MIGGSDLRRDEEVQVLARQDGVRIERITSRGHVSPPGFWYDQREHEWVTLVSGAATLEFRDPDERLELKPGDHVLITARRRHRVAWTVPENETVWLAVSFAPSAAGSGEDTGPVPG
ncbi:MAG: cupin domain-containing protein [Chromatiales bacterium]|nr:cupin domain-containing protein [Chromatiales bacterium]